MHLKTCLVLACILPWGATHAQTQTTVPNAFDAVAGTGTFLGPLASNPRTYQLLIDDSQLTAHLGRSLTSVGFRLPSSALGDWPLAPVTFGSYDIRLSGSVAPSARSLVFGDNVVGEQSLVRSGGLTIDANSFTSGASPNMFGLGIGFDSGYLYSGGDLLIEIRHTGFAGTARSVDALIATGGAPDGYGTLFSAAWSGSYDALNGSQGNFSVLQLTSSAVTVPEPGAFLLIVVGLAGLAARQRVGRSAA